MITVTFRGPFVIPEEFLGEEAFTVPIRVTSTLDNTVTIEVNRREMNTLDILKSWAAGASWMISIWKILISKM